MNKTIKKIVAFSTGALVLGATAGAALAYDLSNYPEPFVKNGAFAGKIVIGEKAGAIDTVGALDIAASLQRAASTTVSSGNGGMSATAEDGYKFQENENLILGGNLTSVITSVDDTELPDLLASGIIEDDDGSEYDYDVDISFQPSDAIVSADIVDADLDGTYTEPVVFFDLRNTEDLFYTVTVDFQDVWDSLDFTESQTIELFGRSYTLDPQNKDNDKLTLFGSDTTLVVAKGESKTIAYNGKDYSVEVLGGNSDDSTAIIRIGSDTRTVSEGDSKTIGGLPIYVKDVFISNIGGEDVSVQLFLGSNKIELDSDGTVTLNGVDLDEVDVTITNSTPTATDNWVNVDSLVFTVTPYNADAKVEYILPGEDYVDPLFGAFKFSFVGAEDLVDGKESLMFERNGKTLDVTFTPRGATEAITITPFEGTTSAGAVHEDFWDAATLNELAEDTIFLYNEKYDGTTGTEDEAITHVLQVKKITKGNDVADTDFEVVVEDLTFDRTYTVDSNDKALDSKITLYARQATTDDEHIDFAETAADTPATYDDEYLTIFTDAGAKVEWYYNNGTDVPIVSGVSLNGINNTFVVTEDVDDDTETSTVDPFVVSPVYDGSTDDEYDLSVSGITTFAGDASDDDDNVDFYLTRYGTYVEAETDDSGQYVNVYVPAEEVAYNMFLLPVSSMVTVTSVNGGGAVSLNPIAVGMAVLDNEITLGSKPLIVVGGPCANTIAAELMGNGADCAAGFSEGKGMIKLFADKNALLVAGYSGKDTQGASRVLAYYKDYKSKFTGTELEVITTNLASLSVNSVN